MGLHFLSNDYGMRLDHREAYDRAARWVLAATVLAGLLVGTLVEVPRPMVDALFAVLAGGVVLNVMKEELSEERKSRFGAFLLGVAGYGTVLLAVS
jgi:ABC-type Mn2+/Zn2+ transport system permease subunit